MAPARPYWKGYLKLSLVSCPIALYTGTSSTERVSFRQINKKTGNRLRQQLIDQVAREPVEGEDKRRGYEYSKNAYIPVDDDELDAVAIESNHTIEIDSFVPREQIDERYLDSAYYITPNDQVGQDAFAVIREAMRGKGMVALARVVLAKREWVIMLEPWDKGLMGTTLRYPYEIRDAKEYFDDIPNVKVEPDMLKLAEHILQSKAADFDPAQFVDHYEEAVVEMLKKKQTGLPVSREQPAPRPQIVVNLMDTLRRSIAQEKAASAPPKRGRKRIEDHEFMTLRAFTLPIDRYVMRAAEVAHPQLGPGLSFGRAYAEPVENGRDAVIRQKASEFAHQLLGRHVGLPAILAGTVLHHFKPRVIPALPVQHEAQPAGLGRDDDLLEAERKIRLRVSAEAAGWFHTAGKSSASASSVARSSSRRGLGCWFCRLLSCSSSRATAARRSFHRRSSSFATRRLSGSTASYCRRACVTS